MLGIIYFRCVSFNTSSNFIYIFYQNSFVSYCSITFTGNPSQSLKLWQKSSGLKSILSLNSKCANNLYN